MDPTVAAVVAAFKWIHEQLRAEVAALDEAALHRTPGEDTNSVAVLVRHMLGSEGEAVRLVAGVPGARDRAAEFRATPATFPRAAALAALDEADRLLEELGPRIGAEQLAAMHRRPSDGYVNSGLGWLLDRHGHVSQHLGHVQLTRQLLERTPDGAAR